MKNRRWLRLLCALFAFTLLAAACGDSDDSSDDTSAEGDGGGDGGDSADGVLTIGTILPVSGSLAFLGPPEVAGSEMAVADINAAGGVNGEDVVLIQGDSGDDTTDIAQTTVDAQLSQNVDVILGAASSAVSKLVIDKITSAGVIQFSPANTSPDFTTWDDNGLYFRTAPSDLLQGSVLADLLADDGNSSVAILFRQEAYGTGLADALESAFTDQGGEVVEKIPYGTDAENFDAEVDQIAGAAPDAVVVIGFAESQIILTTMHEKGVGPTSDVNVYGVDGNIGIGSEMGDPSVLAGMKATAPSVDLTTITEFTARLDENGAGGEYTYGAETYDSVVIVALAAVLAGTDDPAAVAAEINDVTRGGDKCTTFEECVGLIDGGSTDIDYDGVGGPYEFVDAGEPAAAIFRVAQYDGDAAPNTDLDVYVTAGG